MAVFVAEEPVVDCVLVESEVTKVNEFATDPDFSEINEIHKKFQFPSKNLENNGNKKPKNGQTT